MAEINSNIYSKKKTLLKDASQINYSKAFSYITTTIVGI